MSATEAQMALRQKRIDLIRPALRDARFETRLVNYGLQDEAIIQTLESGSERKGRQGIVAIDNDGDVSVYVFPEIVTPKNLRWFETDRPETPRAGDVIPGNSEDLAARVLERLAPFEEAR